MLIADRYQAVQKLREGGTATIYLGVDNFKGERVAIKELKPQFFKDEYMRASLKKEANRYLYLRHPNIVRLNDFIIEKGKHFLIMEYVDGQNLSEYLRNVTGPMPVGMAALLISEVLDALHFAHERNVAHLDIKPSNIMLSSNDEVKVLDFGIAQVINDNGPERTMGTPSYMSPEQLPPSSDVNHLSDIYSCGITLYELITGSTPFNDAKSKEELFHAIRKKIMPSIGRTHAINKIIAKAAAKNKKVRFSNCNEFKESLNPIINTY